LWCAALLILLGLVPAAVVGADDGAPTVPLLFVPGYAASAPKPGTVLAYSLHRGASPQDLELSASYHPFVRSLQNAGYQEGTSFFGAVYDWRMPAAPDDGVFDGTLDLVTAEGITRCGAGVGQPTSLSHLRWAGLQVARPV